MKAHCVQEENSVFYFHPPGYSVAAQARKLVHIKITLLHFVAFFHVASLLSTGVDNEKVGVDNEKALELDNRIFFSYISLISM